MQIPTYNKIFLFLGFMLSIGTTNAEYRVYQYYVASKLSTPQSKNSYKVTSTLNPVTYVAYHGGSSSIKIDLIRTWNCVGHTGAGKPLCPPPSEKLLREGN